MPRFLIMGAASCDLPTIGVSGGPMLSGDWRGRKLASGTGIWQMSEEVRAGRLDWLSKQWRRAARRAASTDPVRGDA